jgi:hypothetical protein
MRILKASIALVGLLALAQYSPIYLRSLQFDDFVKNEAQHIRMQAPLKQALLAEAQTYSLPITESDINFSSSNGVFQVAVDYRVPVNLIVYNHQLTFHAAGSGLLQQNPQ